MCVPLQKMPPRQGPSCMADVILAHLPMATRPVLGQGLLSPIKASMLGHCDTKPVFPPQKRPERRRENTSGQNATITKGLCKMAKTLQRTVECSKSGSIFFYAKALLYCHCCCTITVNKGLKDAVHCSSRFVHDSLLRSSTRFNSKFSIRKSCRFELYLRPRLFFLIFTAFTIPFSYHFPYAHQIV